MELNKYNSHVNIQNVLWVRKRENRNREKNERKAKRN